MRQSVHALLVGAASATMTANYVCNVDFASSGTPAVTWHVMDVPGWSMSDGKDECATKGTTGHSNDSANHAGNTYCLEWRESIDSICNLWRVKTSELTAANEELFVKYLSETPYSTTSIFSMKFVEGGAATAPTVTADKFDNAKSDKMKVDQRVHYDAKDITWAASVEYKRKDGVYYEVNSVQGCQAWCTSKATAEDKMDTKTGVCTYYQ